MPYCRCPKCGASYHILVSGDVAQWYREHAPDQRPGDTVEGLTCFQCWKQSGEGGPSSDDGNPSP